MSRPRTVRRAPYAGLPGGPGDPEAHSPSRPPGGVFLGRDESIRRGSGPADRLEIFPAEPVVVRVGQERRHSASQRFQRLPEGLRGADPRKGRDRFPHQGIDLQRLPLAARTRRDGRCRAGEPAARSRERPADFLFLRRPSRAPSGSSSVPSAGIPGVRAGDPGAAGGRSRRVCGHGRREYPRPDEGAGAGIRHREAGHPPRSVPRPPPRQVPLRPVNTGTP